MAMMTHVKTPGRIPEPPTCQGTIRQSSHLATQNPRRRREYAHRRLDACWALATRCALTLEKRPPDSMSGGLGPAEGGIRGRALICSVRLTAMGQTTKSYKQDVGCRRRLITSGGAQPQLGLGGGVEFVRIGFFRVGAHPSIAALQSKLLAERAVDNELLVTVWYL